MRKKGEPTFQIEIKKDIFEETMNSLFPYTKMAECYFQISINVAENLGERRNLSDIGNK